MKSNIDQLLEIEKKFKLYTLEINGINFWEYFRFSFLQYSILGEKLNLNSQGTGNNQASLVKWGSQIVKSFWQLFKLKHFKLKNKDILILPHSRKIFIDGKYECIYTSNLMDFFEDRAIELEIPYGRGHLIPSKWHNDLFYMDAVMVKSFISETFYKRFKRKKYLEMVEQIKKDLDHALREIEECNEIELNKDKIVDAVATTILRVKKYKTEYRKILNRVHPKVILEVVSYTTSWMALNEIAHEMNIPVIELQHGTMHVDHLAYQYNTDEALPQLPDYILTFSDYWNKLAHLPKQGTKLVSVGFPYFEEQVKKYIGKIRKDNTKITILFVSQWSIGKYLSKLAAEMVELLDMDKYRIIYKLHPGELENWQNNYECLLKPEIEVVDTLERGIYEYFAISDVQVGVYSTAIYEGLGFGLKTYIYDVGHANTMEDLIVQGYAEKIENAKELADYLKLNCAKSFSNIDFWKENSLENILLFVNKYLEI